MMINYQRPTLKFRLNNFMNKTKIAWYYIYRSLKIIAIIIGSLFILLIILFLININSWYSLTVNTINARDNLNSGLYSLLDSNIDKANKEAIAARNEFSNAYLAIEKIENTNFVFKLPILKKEINNLKTLIETGKILSNSFIQVTDLSYQIQENIEIFNRSQAFSLEDKEKLIALAYEFEPELAGLKANIDLALYNLKFVDNSWLILPFKSEVLKLKNQLEGAETILSRGLPILRLIPVLSGWPDSSRFLILFQNNDELRPTGGFIGSLATLEISQFGENIDMQASDVYHYDMPSIEHLETNPPEPIAKYMGLKNWYLRDSNWSPDFPTSARFIEQLFYKESYYADKEFYDLDGIFAITPQLVSDIINLTGPVELEGKVYDAQNLQTLLQYETGIGYRDEDISSWDRKDIIQDIAVILKDRLKNINTREIIKFVEIIDQAINTKDLQTYFTNPQNQLIAENLNSDGSIKSVSYDYLMIVDANLAAFKTDAVMIKDWSYEIKEENNNLIAYLYLNYEHKGGFDWRTTRYRSYTRVLTPRDSKLLSIENARDLKVEDDNDLDKTIIGFFFSVEPQQSKEIKISYQLPNRIKDQVKNNTYQLYLQRQAGSRINSFNFLFLDQPLLTKDLKSDKLIRISN